MKRRLAKERTAARITDAAVAAYRAKDWLALHRALLLAPWNTSPLDVTLGGAAPRGFDPREWAAASTLRRAIEVRLDEERQP